MTKLLKIDKDLLKIIYPGITDKQLDIEYDIFNGITISQKAKNRIPISEEEIDELIEKQGLIKILQAMDGNSALNELNVAESVIKYLEELSAPLKKLKIKKIMVCNNSREDINLNKTKVVPPIFKIKNREILRRICVFIARRPDDPKSKKLEKYLEVEKGKML